MHVKVDAVVEQKGMSNKNRYSFCLFDSITTESTKPLIDLIKDMAEGSILDLYINSRGGSVPVAIGVFNFIKTIKNLEINTYNVGHCDSVAILLFLSGSHRFVLKNSSFFMHSLQLNFTQPQTINTLAVEIKKLKDDTTTLINLLTENSNISRKQWNSLMSDKGTLIRAKKAVTMALTESILDKCYIPKNKNKENKKC